MLIDFTLRLYFILYLHYIFMFINLQIFYHCFVFFYCRNVFHIKCLNTVSSSHCNRVYRSLLSSWIDLCVALSAQLATVELSNTINNNRTGKNNPQDFRMKVETHRHEWGQTTVNQKQKWSGKKINSAPTHKSNLMQISAKLSTHSNWHKNNSETLLSQK